MTPFLADVTGLVLIIGLWALFALLLKCSAKDTKV